MESGPECRRRGGNEGRVVQEKGGRWVGQQRAEEAPI